MKQYFNITSLIYNQPWLILPSAHKDIVNAFEKYIQSDLSMDDDEVMPDDMEEKMEVPISNTSVIDISGPIGKRLGMLELCFGATDLDTLSQQILDIENTPEIENVIFHFNSPGGTITGVEEAGELISELAKKKKCIAYTDTLCASAAYWLASQCDYVYASPSSQVGSVGVYMALMDATAAYAKEGYKPEVFSAGKYKTMGADFRSITDEERTMFQADVDAIYNKFKNAVLLKRTIKDEDLQGQVFTGEQSVEKGLVDGLANSITEVIQLFKH